MNAHFGQRKTTPYGTIMQFFAGRSVRSTGGGRCGPLAAVAFGGVTLVRWRISLVLERVAPSLERLVAIIQRSYRRGNLVIDLPPFYRRLGLVYNWRVGSPVGG